MTTIRIKLPTIEQVEFSLNAEYSDIPVRGNALASGNDKEDKKVEDRIIARLDRGDVWAWCDVKVTAVYRSIEGTDYLGCCSYRDETDFKKDGYYNDMKQAAYNDLIEQIKALK